MSLSFGDALVFLPPSTPQRRAVFPSRHHRLWKRRRLKPLTLRCDLDPAPSPFDNLFQTVLSQFPSINTHNYVAPVIGVASGLALFVSSKSRNLLPGPGSKGNSDLDIGEWILFTSPTPFNRFVTLRCPSICFPGSEFLEDVNERLVEEERHYVKLNSGRMVQLGKGKGDADEDMVYQRVCVVTEDGGVLSLDWPANLDLEEERGLDTTLLVVPGTAEGSNDRKIRAFVCECLKRGIFPLVMNPRGCAGSPLTTARLFSAADSDDISTAVQYINKKRPWTTLMGVGWGYGANMLTKYLAEFGERTPLTAATCIDNPFDLEEFARNSTYHKDFVQCHVEGFIKILQRNKELFQGRGKGFDVESALSAPSVRDFEKSISMVSYGFDSIEDFYAKSSTRDVIGKVKIPVLFIQNDDSKVPLFSIPRSSIAENPFTSLLLCSYSPSNTNGNDRLRFSWCQSLTLEWLTAVELGLLKGRHPLLTDVDVVINPSKGLTLMERTSSKRGRADNIWNLTNGNFSKPPLDVLEENDTDMVIQPRSMKAIGHPPGVSKESQKVDSDARNQSSASIDTLVGDNGSANDRGQVLQTAQVIMNMLNVTMPGVLSDEQKRQVLDAVGQGETIMNALQDAVPEDVREKLTAAVSGIVQSQGSNIKFDELLNLGHIPDVASRFNSKFFGKTRLKKENGDGNVCSSDQKKTTNHSEDDSLKFHQNSGESTRDGDTDTEKQSLDDSQKPMDPAVGQDTSKHGSSKPTLEKANLNGSGNSENEQSSGGVPTEIADEENSPEMKASEEVSRTYEGRGEGNDTVANLKEVEEVDGNGPSGLVEENNTRKNDVPSDQNEEAEAYKKEDKHSAPSPTSKTQLKDSEAENIQKKEEIAPKSISSEGNSNPPRFSVSEALDALTGFDDSTQAAVNSVFNVIEGMIDKFDEKNGEDNGVDNAEFESSVSKEYLTKDDSESAKASDLRGNENSQSDESKGAAILYDQSGSSLKYEQQNSELSNPHNKKIQMRAENETSFIPATGVHPAGNFVQYLNAGPQKVPVPGYSTTLPYDDPLYKEYLKTYLYWKLINSESLDKHKRSTLHLDYIPEEGKWKLSEQTEDNSGSINEGDYREDLNTSHQRSNHANAMVEPSYVILDSSMPNDHIQGMKTIDFTEKNMDSDATKLENSIPLINSVILKCLNVEVGRRVNAADMEELKLKLADEMEYVANAVSTEVAKEKMQMHKGVDNLVEKLGTLDGEKVVRVLSLALQDTQYLKRILPVGVVVGSSLAELRMLFDVAALDGNDEKTLPVPEVDMSKDRHVQVREKETSEGLLKPGEYNDSFSSSISEEGVNNDRQNSSNKIMVGAVTAALGASALLVQQQTAEIAETSEEPLTGNKNSMDPSKRTDIPEKTPNNIISSLAEKALSVASPVVPLKEDGQVDHERLVSMLAELGHKGGILKLVSKVALLWGGIRGAMSLTDKLISFLRIAERPLFQRILGFLFMVLLLWSPVVLPLLPTLIQNWSTPSSFKIAEFACICGLYVSVLIMIALWGKRIRKYDDPLRQYGLDLASAPKIQNLLTGLMGGFILVISIHVMNSALGFAHLHWPTSLSSSSSQPVHLIKSSTWMLLEIVRGIATATAVSIVEELLFRSWLPEEIAVDFGYHHGVILSGLIFALSQRSMWEIPGLWLLSLSLAGARQRNEGNLSLAIGLRSGILASNFMLKTGGFLSYKPNFEMWVTGGHPFQPFSGVAGLACSFILALALYPRQALYEENTRPISE